LLLGIHSTCHWLAYRPTAYPSLLQSLNVALEVDVAQALDTTEPFPGNPFTPGSPPRSCTLHAGALVVIQEVIHADGLVPPFTYLTSICSSHLFLDFSIAPACSSSALSILSTSRKRRSCPLCSSCALGMSNQSQVSPSRELHAVLSIVPTDVVTSLRALDPAPSTALPLATSLSTAAAHTLGSPARLSRPHHRLLRTPGYRRGSSQGSSLSDLSRSSSQSTTASPTGTSVGAGPGPSVRPLRPRRPLHCTPGSATSQRLNPTGPSGPRCMPLIAHVVQHSGDALRKSSLTRRGASVPRCHSPSLRSRQTHACSAHPKPKLIEYVLLEILWRLGNAWETPNCASRSALGQNTSNPLRPCSALFY
jgi:hypothetical protein